MATIDVKDAAGATVALEKPNGNGRQAAAGSRPVALSTEDLAALELLATILGAADANPAANTIGARLKGILSALGGTLTVEAASLPLPAGAATAANQATLIGHVDGVETALASILAKLIAAPATEAKQDTLIAKDFATQTTLAAVLAKIISAPATEAKQDAAITLTGAVTETAPGTDTASSGLNGRLQRIAQRVSALIALLPVSLGAKAAAASMAVTQSTEDAARVATIGTRAYGAIERVASGAASAQSGAITATEVLLHASKRCYVLAGANPTASATTAIPLEAGEKFHMRITSGHKIAVIRDTEDGFLHIAAVA